MSKDAIGWAASLILVFTVGKQVHKQWKDRTSEGVSIWLFVGEIAASLGFEVYSILLRNYVYMATNVLMVASSLAGLYVMRRNRRERRRRPP